jgi:hypothetical protein
MVHEWSKKRFRERPPAVGARRLLPRKLLFKLQIERIDLYTK